MTVRGGAANAGLTRSRRNADALSAQRLRAAVNESTKRGEVIDMKDLLVYLDPGAGSLLLQALVGGVASAAVLAKLYWRRAKRFLGLGREEPRE